MEPATPEVVVPAPENPQTPKDGHWVTILAMALFVLASLGAVAFLYYQNQQLKAMLAISQSQASPTPTATTDPTVNWKTYVVSDNTFSFKYPETIIVGEKVQGKEIIITVKGLLNDITLAVDPIADHNFYQDKTLTSTATLNNIKWNYLTGSIQQCDAGECGTISDALQTETQTKRYTFVLGKLPYPNETLDQILSTFKFLGSTPSSSPVGIY